MQGSYNNNGLPRPYYMKPTKKKSPYDKVPVTYFNTPRRKLVGYIVLLILFGTCIFMISQDMKPSLKSYEIVPKKEATANNIDKMVGSGIKADKENENIGLAGNLAENSKGEVGFGVAEAPKGGIANESPMVGGDEDEILGNINKNKKPTNPNQAVIGGEVKKGYKVDKLDGSI